ncbi:hypothetical protein F5883DRAFT_649727 [Diaporthe sp. PMI_573]|nr:hypothetical protein F5883DRAFT_649727 [Diaporthaceae sp. PMI_573]
MSVDMFLREVARVQIPDGGLSYLSTQKVLSVPPGPSLRVGQKNRVLIYCGAFNPPHTGHVACLVDGLEHLAKDSDLGDLVACIVVPLDDEFLLQKEERKRANEPSASTTTTPMTLSRKNRADLLSSYIHSAASGLDAQLRSMVQVWAPARAKTLTDVPQLLAAEAKNKGFDMDFILLRSWEYLYYGDKGATRWPRVIHSQCSMVIFTNVGGRNNDAILQADGSPRPLEEPWTNWEALVTNEDLGEGVRRTVWSTKSPTSEQRMLDTRNTLKSEPCFSSTRIRRLLYASDFKDRETLEKDIHEAGAIYAGMLILMLDDWADQKNTI